jgi:hypothetical protein
MNFSSNPFDVRNIGYSVLLKYFNCDFLACNVMCAELDLAEGALANGFLDRIVPYCLPGFGLNGRLSLTRSGCDVTRVSLFLR